MEQLTLLLNKKGFSIVKIAILSKRLCSCKEDSSSFRNVLFIWCGICVFKTMEKVHLIISDVLL